MVMESVSDLGVGKSRRVKYEERIELRGMSTAIYTRED